MRKQTLIVLALTLVMLAGCASESELQAERDRANAARAETAYAQAYARSADQRASDAEWRDTVSQLQSGASGLANSGGVLFALVVLVVLGGMFLSFSFVSTQNQQRQWHREEMARLEVERMRVMCQANQLPPGYIPQTRRVIVAKEWPMLPAAGDHRS